VYRVANLTREDVYQLREQGASGRLNNRGIISGVTVEQWAAVQVVGFVLPIVKGLEKHLQKAERNNLKPVRMNFPMKFNLPHRLE
jgi:hypothetical protein